MVMVRLAQQNDLGSIVKLLADALLDSKREGTILPAAAEYQEAFRVITQDKNQFHAVAEIEGRAVGCLKLTFVPGLSHKVMWRGQIEGVWTAKSMRGQGIGRALFNWAIEKCRKAQCGLLQLTTDKTRPDAHEFYLALGFVASHEGDETETPVN